MKTLGALLLGALAAGCGSGDDTIGGGAGETPIHHNANAAAAPAPTPSTATPPVAATPATATDLTPAYWNVDALADSLTPGSEPLNVIITTNIPMDALVDALPRTRNPEQGDATWRRVAVGVGLSGGCISEERASVDGAPTTSGRNPQMLSLRLGARDGCDSVLFDGESHARAWKSESRSAGKDAAGRTIETWYFHVSQEHVCFVDDGFFPKPWHCILPQGFVGILPGINGALFTAPSGGYNQGRNQFVANLKRLAEPNGGTAWTVDCKAVDRGANGAGEGLFVAVSPLFAFANPDAVQVDPRSPDEHILKRVTWDNQATHCSIMQ